MASKPKYLQVENHAGYARDTRTNAIVSDDRTSYESFVAKKRERREFKDRLSQVESTLEQILDKIENLEHFKK